LGGDPVSAHRSCGFGRTGRLFAGEHFNLDQLWRRHLSSGISAFAAIRGTPALKPLHQRPPVARRMLEHYSHIRIDAKRQALGALDAARRTTTGGDDRVGKRANGTEIAAIVNVGDDLTSPSRHSLTLSGDPPSR
jgi:hypothetical protein